MSAIFDESFQTKLAELGRTRAGAYAAAKPFPHAVIDDFLPESDAEAALAAFPSAGEGIWEKFYSQDEKKKAFFNAEALPAALRDILLFLNSAPVLKFLEAMTGIDALLPDPYFYGGGLHQTERGGFLKMHADFNRLARLNLERRLNLLIYLNRNWEESYGGHLQLWDSSMTRCEAKILPVFNRCVVFTTTDTSFHGVPEPVACPEGMSRKSIAIYYYTAPKPGADAAPLHSTIFREIGEGANAAKNGRAGDSSATAPGLKNTIKRFVPPIALDAWRAIKPRR